MNLSIRLPPEFLFDPVRLTSEPVSSETALPDFIRSHTGHVATAGWNFFRDAILQNRSRIMSAKYHFHDAHDLELKVHFVLAKSPHFNVRDIQCQVIDHDVVLTGCVRTYYQKQMAQESLRQVSGIRWIKNELTVSGNARFRTLPR